MGVDVGTLPRWERLGRTRLVIPAIGTGLHHDNVLFCQELTTIDESFLTDGPRGRVADDLLVAVVMAVRRAVGDFSV